MWLLKYGVVAYLICGIATFGWWEEDWIVRTGQWRRIDATVLVGPLVVLMWPATLHFLITQKTA